MNNGAPTTYDTVPWVDLAHEETHPDRLATIATLHGMRPAAVETCRVLELGCAQGGNLIPMALDLPRARFVGIDLSNRQIEEGRASIEGLGLSNLELKAASILDIDAGLGTFDYILCHGVYSWVPDQVREKILSLCARNLNPQGVAYLSYNVYPGWHARTMLRDMMSYHARQFAEPSTQVQQSRAILDFVVNAVRYPESPFGRQLAESTAELAEDADWYLYHEYLESDNRPFYFHEFAADASASGMQYLGSAYFRSWDTNLPPQTEAFLSKLAPDRVRREQYLDFLCNTSFRRSLLCHGDINLREPAPETVDGLRVQGLARPLSATPALDPCAEEDFASPSGDCLTTDSPVVKAILAALHAVRPASVALDELEADVRHRLADAGIEAGESGLHLREILLQAAFSNLVALHVHEPRLVTWASDRPVASPWARRQSRAGREVTNQRHARVNLTELERTILGELDGRHDRAALCELLADVLKPGDPRTRLDDCLARLASEALLIA